jgi:hypothetical protein
VGRWVEAPGWHKHVEQDGHDAVDRVSAAVLEDMRQYCPVDTGELIESLDRGFTDDTTARVGSKGVKHSVYVEEGHEIVYRGADGELVRTGEFVEPQPYMRPALYQERAL